MKPMKELFAKQAIIFSVLILSIVAITIFSSYAFYFKVEPEEIAKSVETENLRISYSNSGYDAQINIDKIIPTPYLDALEEDPKVLTIFNKSTENVRYKIYLVNTNEEENYVTSEINKDELLPRKYIYYKIGDDDLKRLDTDENEPIYTGSIKGNTNLADTININVWIDEQLPSIYKNDQIHLKFLVKEMTKNQYGEEDTLINKIITYNGGKEKIESNKPSSFSLAAVESENNLYFDLKSKNYYYRGGALNNNVMFTENGFLWKIVNFNQDGSIKLILNDEYLDDSLITNYVGIEKVLNNWYEKYIANTKYNKHIIRSNYCTNSYLNENYEPSMNCDSKYIFESPIGLLTSDEYMYSGLTLNYRNSLYYLASNFDTYTMTKKDDKNIFIIKDNTINLVGPDTELYLRPVINIDGKLNVISGDGSSNDPYVLEINED